MNAALQKTVYTTTAILSEKRKRMHSSGLQYTWHREYHYLVESWPCGWPILRLCAHKVSSLCNTRTVLLISNELGFILWDFRALVLHTYSRYWFHSKDSKGAIWKDCKSRVWVSGDVCYWNLPLLKLTSDTSDRDSGCTAKATKLLLLALESFELDSS